MPDVPPRSTQRHRPVLEFQEFVGLGIAESVDTGHTITHGEHGAYLVELLCVGDTLELVEQDLGYFAWFNLI